MLTYHEADTKLGSRDQKKVGNNRWLSRGAWYWIDPVTGEAWIVDKDDPRGAQQAIDFTLHRTPVVSLLPSGHYVVRTGGWMTVTTKAAINEVIPTYLCSHRGEWIIGDVEFEDGMVLDSIGEPLDYKAVG